MYYEFCMRSIVYFDKFWEYLRELAEQFYDWSASAKQINRFMNKFSSLFKTFQHNGKLQCRMWEQLSALANFFQLLYNWELFKRICMDKTVQEMKV